MATSTPAAASDPTASEVYDRQIRLWGLEAQKRMQESKVLFIGMRALQTEVGIALIPYFVLSISTPSYPCHHPSSSHAPFLYADLQEYHLGWYQCCSIRS